MRRGGQYAQTGVPRRATISREARAEQRRRDRVRKAAEYCADVVYSGWPDAVASRASTYVSEATWDRLMRGRGRQHCKALAELARKFLGLKDEIHGIFGWLASGVLALFGAGDAARAFANELVSHIPLPMDAKVIAAARGVQVTGILVCVVNGDDLDSCQCFIDLALHLTKAQVKRLLLVAAHDWTKLKAFPPSVPRRPTL